MLPLDLVDIYGDYLDCRHPLDALASKDPWRIGVALVLAAHCSDAAMNKATPNFLQHYPTWREALNTTRTDIIPFIPGISHSGNKSDYIANWANYLSARDGQIEPSIEALTRIKGFGRKTAGIVLYTVNGIDEVLPLDTHALRIFDRLGWLPETKNAQVREKQLLPHVPPGRRFKTFLVLTQHGRRVCEACAPQCSSCKLQRCCRYFMSKPAASA